MKTLKILLIFLLIIPFTSCNKDDEKVVVEETTNIRPSIIKVNNNLDGITVFKIEYNTIGKISKIEKTRDALTVTDTYTYNDQKLTKIITNTGSSEKTYLVTYSEDGKLATITDGSETLTFTPTASGYTVIISGIGFDLNFNGKGQLIKYDETILSINENVKGPFYNVELDAALLFFRFDDFFYFNKNAITSFTNFLVFTNSVVTNTTNDNGYVETSYIDYDENVPQSPTDVVTYTYQ